MRIRPAQAGDLEAIVRTERASFSTPWSRGTFLALLSRDTVLFRVAEGEGGKILGHGILWWVGDEGELANLAVVPEARAGGIGRQLLDALLAEAAIRGVHCVFLEVRASNEAAQRLYESRGFEAVGHRRDYYVKPREDARVLRLDLSSAPTEAP